MGRTPTQGTFSRFVALAARIHVWNDGEVADGPSIRRRHRRARGSAGSRLMHGGVTARRAILSLTGAVTAFGAIALVEAQTPSAFERLASKRLAMVAGEPALLRAFLREMP